MFVFLKRIIIILKFIVLTCICLNLIIDIIIINFSSNAFDKVEPYYIQQSYNNDVKFCSKEIYITDNTILQCFLKKTKIADDTIYSDLNSDLYFCVDDNFNMHYIDGNIYEIWNNNNIRMYISRSSKIRSVKINPIEWGLMYSNFELLKFIRNREHGHMESACNYINYINDKSVYVTVNNYENYHSHDKFWHILSFMQFNQFLLLVKIKILSVKYSNFNMIYLILLFIIFIFAKSYKR